MPVFDHLVYWKDGAPRKGSENMAIDQCLLEQIGAHPILRVYQWSEPSVSFGYFHKLAEVKQAYPPGDTAPIHYVRRWTGGGIVDHRVDLTYTLVVPLNDELGYTRGAASYHVIHRELCKVLAQLGEKVELVEDAGECGTVCFDNPVAYDLVNQAGYKVAGAGQRRTKHGLLHQGSVLTRLDADVFGQQFANQLAVSQEKWRATRSHAKRVAEMELGRYGTKDWLMKR